MKTGMMAMAGLLALLGCGRNHDDTTASTYPRQDVRQEISSADQEFLKQATYANLGEVDLGRLAQKKAFNKEVGKFGEHMVEDHTAADKQVNELAAKLGVALPVSTDDEHRQLYTKLNDLNGAEFDRQYITSMVDGHEKVVKKFETAAKSGGDTQVRAFAAKMLPSLQKHLTMARELKAKSLGSDPN